MEVEGSESSERQHVAPVDHPAAHPMADAADAPVRSDETTAATLSQESTPLMSLAELLEQPLDQLRSQTASLLRTQSATHARSRAASQPASAPSDKVSTEPRLLDQPAKTGAAIATLVHASSPVALPAPAPVGASKRVGEAGGPCGPAGTDIFDIIARAHSQVRIQSAPRSQLAPQRSSAISSSTSAVHPEVARSDSHTHTHAQTQTLPPKPTAGDAVLAPAAISTRTEAHAPVPLRDSRDTSADRSIVTRALSPGQPLEGSKAYAAWASRPVGDVERVSMLRSETGPPAMNGRAGVIVARPADGGVCVEVRARRVAEPTQSAPGPSVPSRMRFDSLAASARQQQESTHRVSVPANTISTALPPPQAPASQDDARWVIAHARPKTVKVQSPSSIHTAGGRRGSNVDAVSASTTGTTASAANEPYLVQPRPLEVITAPSDAEPRAGRGRVEHRNNGPQSPTAHSRGDLVTVLAGEGSPSHAVSRASRSTDPTASLPFKTSQSTSAAVETGDSEETWFSTVPTTPRRIQRLSTAMASSSALLDMLRESIAIAEDMLHSPPAAPATKRSDAHSSDARPALTTVGIDVDEALSGRLHRIEPDAAIHRRLSSASLSQTGASHSSRASLVSRSASAAATEAASARRSTTVTPMQHSPTRRGPPSQSPVARVPSQQQQQHENAAMSFTSLDQTRAESQEVMILASKLEQLLASNAPIEVLTEAVAEDLGVVELTQLHDRAMARDDASKPVSIEQPVDLSSDPAAWPSPPPPPPPPPEEGYDPVDEWLEQQDYARAYRGANHKQALRAYQGPIALGASSSPPHWDDRRQRIVGFANTAITRQVAAPVPFDAWVHAHADMVHAHADLTPLFPRSARRRMLSLTNSPASPDAAPVPHQRAGVRTRHSTPARTHDYAQAIVAGSVASSVGHQTMRSSMYDPASLSADASPEADMLSEAASRRSEPRYARHTQSTHMRAQSQSQRNIWVGERMYGPSADHVRGRYALASSHRAAAHARNRTRSGDRLPRGNNTSTSLQLRDYQTVDSRSRRTPWL